MKPLQRILVLVALVSVLSTSAFSAEPVAKIDGTPEANVDDTVAFSCTGSKWDDNAVAFLHPFVHPVKAYSVLDTNHKPLLIVPKVPVGTHTIYLVCSGKMPDGKIRTVTDKFQIVVKGDKPTPDPKPDPDDPDPKPDPDDPEPDPDPDPEPDDPAPIKDLGFRVLVIYESNPKDGEKLTRSQQEIVTGVKVRKYLNETCVKVDNDPEYRIIDQHQDLSSESKIWQDAVKRHRISIPWLIISNGETGFEGPLPDTLQSFMNLCKKYEK